MIQEDAHDNQGREMTTTEQIIILARRLIELGVVPDDDGDYEEFEEIVIKLDDALNDVG
jgi:hypothetical protein